MPLKGACIFGQSGGPTPVINASAYGVIKTALEAPEITRVLGAAHGIKGVLDDVLYDMSHEDARELSFLMQTPSSALGSCRYKLADLGGDEKDYDRIFEIFRKYDVRYFFYNGGNDSMDTCNKVSKYLSSRGYECRVIGVPKTIDNDLAGTDHCPGYGSAAKYIATSVKEVWQDAHVYDKGTVTVIECMGRNAGWLTAASALASLGGTGPDLIYMPEIVFDVEAFVKKVEFVFKAKGGCVAVVSEGIKNAGGTFISELGGDSASVDAFGHKQMGGVAAQLAALIKARTGAKTRGIELSLLQRCAAHCASKADVEEAFLVGQQAVKAAISGESGKMVSIHRGDNEYRPFIELVDLAVTANAEHKFPLDWITSSGDGIKDEFIGYALPLIAGQPEIVWEDGMPKHARLKKVRA